MPPESLPAGWPARSSSAAHCRHQLDLFGEARAGEALVIAEGEEVFAAGEARVNGDFLGDPAEGLAGGAGAGVGAEDADLAGVGEDAAHDAADQRAFAGAVGAEQAEALAGIKTQGNTIDGGERAKALDEIRDFNGKLGYGGGRGCGGSHPTSWDARTDLSYAGTTYSARELVQSVGGFACSSGRLSRAARISSGTFHWRRIL